MSSHPSRPHRAGRWTVELTAPDGAASQVSFGKAGESGTGDEATLRTQWPYLLDMLLDAQHETRERGRP